MVQDNLQRIDKRTLAGTRMTQEERTARARTAGNALLAQSGLEYYSYLGMQSAKARRDRESNESGHISWLCGSSEK